MAAEGCRWTRSCQWKRRTGCGPGRASADKEGREPSGRRRQLADRRHGSGAAWVPELGKAGDTDMTHSPIFFVEKSVWTNLQTGHKMPLDNVC